MKISIYLLPNGRKSGIISGYPTDIQYWCCNLTFDGIIEPGETKEVEIEFLSYDGELPERFELCEGSKVVGIAKLTDIKERRMENKCQEQLKNQ